MARFETLDRVVQWIVTLALLGMPQAVLRLAAGRPEREAAVHRTAIGLVVVTWAAVYAVVLFVSPLYELLLGDVERGAFALYGVRAVCIATLSVTAAVLHAKGRFGRRAVLDASDRVLGLVCLLALASAVAFRDFGGAVWAGALGSCIALLVAWLPLGETRALFRRSRAPTAAAGSETRDLLAIGRPQLVLSVLELLRPLVLLRIAVEISGEREAGLLATAAAFSLPLIAVPEMVALALFPRMLGPEGERAHVETEKRRLVREMLLAGIPPLVLYGALAAWLLPLPKDGGYAGAVVPLLALLPGVLAHGITAYAGYVLLVRDRLGSAALVSALTLVLTAAGAAALLPVLGALGGAVALSAALVVRSALLLLLARR